MSTEMIFILIATLALFGLPFWARLFQKVRGSQDQIPGQNPQPPKPGVAAVAPDSGARRASSRSG